MKYLCNKDYVMDDDDVAFVSGKIYKCVSNTESGDWQFIVIDEDGDMHDMDKSDMSEFFTELNDELEPKYPTKKDNKKLADDLEQAMKYLKDGEGTRPMRIIQETIDKLRS